MANLGAIAIAVLILAAVAATVPRAEGNGDQKEAVISRFLADQSKSVYCTHKNGLCRKTIPNIKGSVKSICCKHSCVNALTNPSNCGACGKACSFGYACCNGKCTNIAYDRNNCGSCDVTCSNKDKCIYGMCSYAWPIFLSFFVISYSQLLRGLQGNLQTWLVVSLPNILYVLVDAACHVRHWSNKPFE